MKWKTKKTSWGFVYIKYSKFWSVSLEHFVERKPLIYEEWGKTKQFKFTHLCLLNFFLLNWNDFAQSKKTTWVFFFIKYSKFWSISLEHFVERKPLISKEWLLTMGNDRCNWYKKIAVEMSSNALRSDNIFTETKIIIWLINFNRKKKLA